MLHLAGNTSLAIAGPNFRGLDEMRTITEDKWKDNVWGSGLPNDPMLYMYFGQNVSRPKTPEHITQHNTDTLPPGPLRAKLS